MNSKFQKVVVADKRKQEDICEETDTSRGDALKDGHFWLNLPWRVRIKMAQKDTSRRDALKKEKHE